MMEAKSPKPKSPKAKKSKKDKEEKGELKKEWEAIDPEVCAPPWTRSMWEDDEERKSKLEEFKKEVGTFGEGESDFVFVRFLVARQWNVRDALDMFITSKKWRERTRTDYILEDFPKSPFFQVLCDYWPNSATSRDREPFLRTRDGMTFAIECLGAVDPASPSYFPMDEIFKCHMYQAERLFKQIDECCKEVGGDVYSPLVWLEDLEGLGLGHMSSAVLNIVKMTGKMDSENYPESLRKVLIINCPKVFSVIWKVAQHFFDEGQKSKFEFFGVGDDYQTKLHKMVAPEYLPKKYGGELDWAPPPGGDIKKLGLEIPKQAKKKWVKAEVPRGGTYEKEIVISTEHIGASLLWEFKTVKHDVGFCVHYIAPDSSDREEIVEPIRVESHLSEVYGVREVEKEGKYVLHWFNTYSWYNSKDLKYLCRLEMPSGESTQFVEKGVATKGDKADKEKSPKEKRK